MKLIEGFDSNYRYVLVAARRARQLSGGAPPLVETSARKVCKIAQEEIAAGKIQYIVKDGAAAPAAEEKTGE
ncbi:MAG TPA: DNA-directed RNA polymerase subunit omega [Alphaproteobacteria bacterium]|nr:DNA-directed RNA polymerase subunit omega [Alphaproteobacteria bacterium]